MTDHPSFGAAGDDRDQIVLDLRSTGRSFAFIARTLNMANARDARAAFVRAVQQSPAEDRPRLRGEELSRLQKLEDGLRRDSSLAPFDRDRQLDILKRLRAQLTP
jgi:hypothetical protein